MKRKKNSEVATPNGTAILEESAKKTNTDINQNTETVRIIKETERAKISDNQLPSVNDNKKGNSFFAGFKQLDAKKLVGSEGFNNNWPIVCIALTVISYFVSLIFYASYDNDIWFILASGREILENGFFDTNPFTFREDMHIVIQQWIPDVLAYLVYSAWGFVGLGLMLTFFIGILLFSLYKLGRLIRGNFTGAEIIVIFSGITLFGLHGYLSDRPHVYTMIAFVWILYFCEKYKRTNNWKNTLVFLPIIVAVHINFHMAMTPFDLVIIGCYLIPDLLYPFHKFNLLKNISLGESYARIPLLIALIASAVAMLLNPYTIDGALYLVNSYGSAEYRDYIKEMGTTNVWSVIGCAMMINIVLGSISLGRIGTKKMHLPFSLLFLGCIILSLQHVRNIWLVSFFAFPLIMLAAKDISFEFKKVFPPLVESEKGITAIFLMSTVVCTLLIFAMNALDFKNPETDTTSVPVVAMDYLDSVGADKETTRIYNGFNPGGYIEYRGYKCNMDPRPELWSPGITKLDFNYYTEFVDMTCGDGQDAWDYMKKYDFDYIIANTDTDLHKFLMDGNNQSEYEIAISGNEYNLWKKKTIVKPVAMYEVLSENGQGDINGTE